MSMEKITKEELLNKLGGVALSDDELERVTGGNNECTEQADIEWDNCQANCISSSTNVSECLINCSSIHKATAYKCLFG